MALNWHVGKAAWRYAPLAATILVGLLVVAIGFLFVALTTRQLLEAEARLDASKWAGYFAERKNQIEDIASGKTMSKDLIEALSHAQAVGNLQSFSVYDSSGNLKLFSGDRTRRPVDERKLVLSYPEFAASVRNEVSATIVRQGSASGSLSYTSSALLPLTNGRRLMGWLVINLDQSERQALFENMTSKISAVVGFLMIAATVFGFRYRTRQRAISDERIEAFSRTDQLTGFFNRPVFLGQLDEQLAAMPENAPQLAMILCEVSGMTAILQNHGQDAEDHLIRLSAVRLEALSPPGSRLARAGRDSLALLVPNVSDPMSVLALARDISAKLSEPEDWAGHRLAFQAHAGIALSSSDGRTAAELIRNAEMALRSAQEQGSPGYGFFNPEIAQDTRRRAAVREALERAVSSQSFRLDFQPVYKINSGELSGFEALIRLHDPELGAISPGEFIPIAEQAGHINEIGAWCIAEACRVASQWPAHLLVAVNLSPSQFNSGSLISDVRNAMVQSAFPAYRLEVEITEGTLLQDSEIVLQQLRILRDMGVAVALDDFGTGYSSLSYLWKFPFSKLKIDRSFVHALDETQSAKGILRSIIKLGHSLGLTVTAEGIETSKQLSTLRDLGCDLAQGYLLDRPAKVADLAAIIMRNFANSLTRRSRDSASASAGKSAA